MTPVVLDNTALVAKRDPSGSWGLQCLFHILINGNLDISQGYLWSPWGSCVLLATLTRRAKGPRNAAVAILIIDNLLSLYVISPFFVPSALRKILLKNLVLNNVSSISFFGNYTTWGPLNFLDVWVAIFVPIWQKSWPVYFYYVLTWCAQTKRCTYVILLNFAKIL